MENNNYTGYASIDKPSRKFYKEGIDEIIREGTEKKVYDFLKEKNLGYSNDPVYSYFGETKSFGYFDEKIDEYAKALKRYGLNKGDVVTICLPNMPDTMMYFYACNRIGVTPYLIDPRSTPKRVKECMELSNSKLLISILDVMGKSVISNEIPSDNIVVVSPHNDFLKSKVGKEASAVKSLYIMKENLYRLENLLKRNKKVVMQEDFTKRLENYGVLIDSPYDPDIPASIVNTSGTTGSHKGAMESNVGYNITANQIEHIAPYLKRGMTYYGYIPFFSFYGSTLGLHIAATHGIVIDTIPKFDATKFDKIFVTKKPNIVIGVPKLFSKFSTSEYINNTDLSFSKLLVVGGDNMSPAKIDEVNEALKRNGCEMKLTYGYGATEAMNVSAMHNDELSHKPGSCGVLYPGVYVRITDRDTLKEVKYGEEGEIYVSTPNLFMGYVGNEKESKDSIYVDPDTGIKYYKTADKGHIDEDGILYLDGRYKRLMKRPDGHQVSAIPIENAIGSLDYVSDVSVVGITNKYQNEGVIPTAFIQFKSPENAKEKLKDVIFDIKGELSGEREMALAYTAVDRIPYTLNGKVDFNELNKHKFEDLDFIVIDDPIFEDYFIQGEMLEKVNLNNKKLIKKK